MRATAMWGSVCSACSACSKQRPSTTYDTAEHCVAAGVRWLLVAGQHLLAVQLCDQPPATRVLQGPLCLAAQLATNPAAARVLPLAHSKHPWHHQEGLLPRCHCRAARRHLLQAVAAVHTNFRRPACVLPGRHHLRAGQVCYHPTQRLPSTQCNLQLLADVCAWRLLSQRHLPAGMEPLPPTRPVVEQQCNCLLPHGE
jgi:hypothetical protein